MNLDTKKLLDFLGFIRFSNGLMVIISIYLYLFLSNSFMIFEINILFIILAALSSFFSGNIINDIFDYQIDLINKEHRYLPSGKVTLRSAKKVYLLFIVLSVLCASMLTGQALLLLILNNLLLFFYSYIFKKYPLIGNILVAYLSASIFIFCELSLHINGPLFIIFTLTFFIHFIREIIKDIEDIDGDSRLNIKTFPIVFGQRKTKILIILLCILFVVFSVLVLNPMTSQSYLFSFLLLLLIPIIYLFYKIIRAKNKNDFSFLSSFVKFQMVLGLIFLLINKHDITQIKLPF